MVTVHAFSQQRFTPRRFSGPFIDERHPKVLLCVLYRDKVRLKFIVLKLLAFSFNTYDVNALQI